MMFSRFNLALAAACAVVISMSQVNEAVAFDSYWQGDDVSNDFRRTNNWDFILNPGGTGLISPRASNGERAVIGTDNPNVGSFLSSDSAPFGSPAISTTTARPGGIALGMRQFDYDEGIFPNPVPAAGALVGRLTIATGGNTISETATNGEQDFGADGRLLVGVEGRGFLTMTGGTLTGPALVVAGETNATVGTDTSMVDLSGSAALLIQPTGTPPTGAGTATFGRRLRVTGPSVNFNSTGQLRLQSTNSYTAAITSATAHSPLKTGAAAIIGGSLAVEFSGAAATRDPITSLGTTWTLVDATAGMTGSFNNISPITLDVPVSGLDAAHSAPLGAVYRLRQTPSGGHTLLQLVYDKVLVLRANRDTGELTIRNPHAGAINIIDYSVLSANGDSLLPSYAGLGAGTPGAGTWLKAVNNNQNGLYEYKETQAGVPVVPYDLSSVSSVSLGAGFDKFGVDNDVANFGNDGEDLVFEYNTPTGTTVRGHVEYIGTKYENNLVLRVNPNNGQAFIKNDSAVTLKFDGYNILSSAGGLSSTGFTGLGGSWESSPGTSIALTQTNLTGSTTMAPGAQLELGNITNSAALSAAVQAGLSMQFILAEGLVSSPAGGDYNNNGVVDAGDYTLWRNNLNTAFQLQNEGGDFPRRMSTRRITRSGRHNSG